MTVGRITGVLALLASGLTAQEQPPVRVEAGPIVVHAWPGQEAVAARLVEAISRQPPLPALPDTVLAGETVDIFLAPDEARFRQLTGGRAPDWGAGVAQPAEGRIVLPAYASTRGRMQELPTVARHELAHVALERALTPAAIPRWFTEGYATWAAGQLDFEAGWVLRLAFLTGTAPPLDSITLGWPSDAARARVAYLLSASAIAWLHEHGGDRVMRIFLQRWAASGRMEEALRSTYGLTLGQFEKFWSESVRSRYGWLRFFAQASVAWSVLTLLVLVLFIIRRRRDRRRMQQLRASEIPDAPAYWLDPPSPFGEAPQLDAPAEPPRDLPP